MGLLVKDCKDETDLIQRSRAGDLDAFNVLVERHQRGLYNLCLRMLGSVPSAEDATQEAFLAAYLHLGSFRGGSFRAWLYRIGANACHDEMRRRRSRPAVSLESGAQGGVSPVQIPDRGPSPLERLEQEESAAVIQRALDALPADQRLAAILCDVQGLDYKDIAVVMGVPLGTVKSRIARARARLRDLLQAAAR